MSWASFDLCLDDDLDLDPDAYPDLCLCPYLYLDPCVDLDPYLDPCLGHDRDHDGLDDGDLYFSTFRLLCNRQYHRKLICWLLLPTIIILIIIITL